MLNSVIKSDSRDIEYRLVYTFNDKQKETKWKKFPKKQNKNLTLKAKRWIPKDKHQINTFEYFYKYKLPNGDIKKTSPYTVDKKLPCGKNGVVTTTTSIVVSDRKLRFTDVTDGWRPNLRILTPTTTLAPTTTTTLAPTTTTTLAPTTTTTLAPTTTTTLAPTTTTTLAPTTTTTLAECNDEDFKPYTLYDSDGNANTVMSCQNEQDALNLNYTYTNNPKPPPPTTTTSTTTTTTSTTTTTIPDPSSTVSQSLGSCSGPSGTRTSTLSITNNESYTTYYLVEYSTNSGSSFTTAQTNQSISGGATNTTNTVVVSDGASIIWRYKDSRTSNDFSNASYVTLSTSDTVDCPDGYYVNVDGSNTYALTLDCKKWNSNTRSLFRGNPWWGSQSTARSYMFALIALTGDYDDGDSDVEVTDYFNYPDSGNCFGIVNEAWFPWKRQNDAYVGWSFYAPEWNSESLSSSWSSNDHENFVFAELVP